MSQPAVLSAWHAIPSSFLASISQEPGTMHQNLRAQLVTSPMSLVKVQRCRAMEATDS